MSAFHRLVSRLSYLGAVMAVLLMFAMTAHIMLEITLRATVGMSTQVLDEFVGYGVAAMTFLSLAYALESGVMIRVGLLLAAIGDGITRRLLELFCITITLGLTGFLAWYFWHSVSRNWSRGATSSTAAEVPLWIPEGAVLLGLALLGLQLISYLLRVLTGGSLIHSGGAGDH